MFFGAVTAWSQDLSDVEEQTSLSQVLNAAGTLYVLETHDLPAISIYRSSNDVECEIAIVRVLGSSELSPDDTITIGLELTFEEEYAERSARLDMHEAQALLAAFEIIEGQGKEILASPTVDSKATWSAEIHFATKEQVKVAAFFDRARALRYGLKIGSRADWVLLTDTGVSTLIDNLTRFVQIGHTIED